MGEGAQPQPALQAALRMVSKPPLCFWRQIALFGELRTRVAEGPLHARMNRNTGVQKIFILKWVITFLIAGLFLTYNVLLSTI